MRHELGRDGLDLSTAADIRGAVCEALRSDPVIDQDDIVVKIMGGDVLLNGTVPSEAQRSEVTVAAQRVAGGSTVHNLLAVALPANDYGDDAALAEFANEALTANAAVPASVQANAHLGNIYLTGTVSTATQSSAAQGAVTGVGGVLTVTNQIVVLSTRPLGG
jgi:osmotically-inducible protein OsmY